MTEEEIAKERAKDYTDNEKRQAAYECGFLDGVDYGYNKANEWHYVKDGDLPKEEGDYLFYLYDKETKYTFYEVLGIARTYADRDDLYIESMIWTLEDVIAWKEIVLPKESE